MLELRNFNVSVDAFLKFTAPLSRAKEFTQAQTGIHNPRQLFLFTQSPGAIHIYSRGGNLGFQGSKREFWEREWLSHTVPHTNSLTSQTADLGAGPGKLYIEEGQSGNSFRAQEKYCRYYL